MSEEDLKSYRDKGFLCLDKYKILLNENLENKISSSVYSEKFYESDGLTVRSYYGFHKDAEIRSWLLGQNSIKEICCRIYGDEDIYIHQSKLNIKNKSESSVWPYHRDFPFWNVFDGIVQNRLLNLVIFLDDVDESNGALSFIPKSQHCFLEREQEFSKQEFTLEGSASNNLLFDFSEEELDFFVQKFGKESCTGPKGTVLIFDPDIVHGSSFSTEDFSRNLLILTFNLCSNKPKIPAVRPDYLCSTDFSPLQWN
jgi:ectoine hydroxylase